MSGRSAHSDNEPLVSLSDCLFGGDPEQLARERRIRREALFISIFFQTAAVAALVLVPLLISGDLIALAKAAPRPPYLFVAGPPTPHPPSPPGGRVEVPPNGLGCVFCPPTSIPQGVPLTGPQPPVRPIGDDLNQIGNNSFWRDGLIPIFGPGPRDPQPPDQSSQATHKTPRILRTHLEPAMLQRRVEPIYPILCVQTHREGRVELHAVIATDGTIQSLEVISGDPFFIQSALSAVRQWRYRPTILNGIPVEVETQISVIYQLQH